MKLSIKNMERDILTILLTNMVKIKIIREIGFKVEGFEKETDERRGEGTFKKSWRLWKIFERWAYPLAFL